MGRLNTARAAALWERGSRTEVANASWSDGENSSLAPCVITKRMPTLTALPTSITRFIASGIGSRAKQTAAPIGDEGGLAGGGTHALCGYRSWGRSLGRATPLIQARPVCR